MPLWLACVCTAQALALDQTPLRVRSIFVLAQAAAPLIDYRRVRRAQRPVQSSIVALQGALFALTLLVPQAVAHIDPEARSGALSALAKTLAPFVSLLLSRRPHSQAAYYAAALSWLGTIVAQSAAHPLAHKHTSGGGGALIHMLLLGNTVLGCLLGVLQESYGTNWNKLSLWTVCVLAVFARSDFGRLTADDVPALLAYAALSLLVQRTVRAHLDETQNDAFLLSLALTERRALTALLSAATVYSPARMVLGTCLALGGSLYAGQRAAIRTR